MNDTEPVTIHSLDPPRKIGDGRLFLGGHGLPLLHQYDRTPETQYDVWSFPHNWYLKGKPSVLLDAWRTIEQVMNELRDWEHRHDHANSEEGKEDAPCPQ